MQGNYNSVSHILPAEVRYTEITNSTEKALDVINGGVIAAYVSEGDPVFAEEFNIFSR